MTVDQVQSLLRLVGDQPRWGGAWRSDSGLLPLHVNAPALPSLRAWRLLQELLTPAQRRSLRACGMAIEEQGDRRHVLDLPTCAVDPIVKGTVELLCIGARDVCLLDQLVAKLLWVRADPATYRAEARLLLRQDDEAFADRLYGASALSDRICAHYDAGMVGRAGRRRGRPRPPKRRAAA